jgi:2-polyprenyl-3-methyl-5-hydroxy-6-metoxy-1,4-benzoquinol methylase
MVSRPPVAWAAQDRHFDARATTWTDRYRTRASFQARLDVVGRAIDDALTDIPDGRVLDFGGGTGVFAVLAAQRAAFVVCIDRSTLMLRQGADGVRDIEAILAAAGFDRPAATVSRVAGDAVTVDPGVARFDLVLAIAVLEYVADCISVVARLALALQPGGRILLTVPNPRSPLRLVQRFIGPLASTRRLRSLRLADQSFVRMRPHGDHVPWREAAASASLRVTSKQPIPLGAGTGRRRLHPSVLIALTKPLDETVCTRQRRG